MASRKLKAQRWKQAERERVSAARAEAAELRELRREAEARGLQLQSFEITHEPIADPLMDALPAEDRARVQEAAERLYDDPASVLGALEDLLARHPHVPTLWNFLTVSVLAAGDGARAEALVEETYRRFPEYLFGIAEWVMRLLRDDRLEEATAVLGGRLGLTAWWPERRVYHASEFVSFNAMLGCYFARTGRLDAARTHLELIDGLLPDHPGMRVLEATILIEALRPLAEGRLGGPPDPEVVVTARSASPAARLLSSIGAG